MTRIFLLLIMFMPCLLISQEMQREKFSTRLLSAVDSRSGGQHEVYVVLNDQIDIDRMVDSFEMAGTPIRERAIQINKRLRMIANRSQPTVMDQIIDLGIDQVTPVWIVNALFFNADAQQLVTMSGMPEVKFLDLNVPLKIDDPAVMVKNSESRSAEGSREPGLTLIKAPFMWEKGYTGYGQKAFIMDTGIDPTHPALERNYAGNAIPEDQAWFGQLNRFDRPYDCASHGTHVTGTILGIDRKAQDTIGVAYNAMWTGAPILRVCGGNTAIRMVGFQWATDPDNNPETTEDMMDVINNSWTDTMVEDCYEVYKQLLTTVEATGVAVVFAAGNDGPDPQTISQPKNINKSLVNTFAVGAINAANLQIADFSSRGPSKCGGEGSILIKPEVSAPGVNVRSCVPGNTYANFNGTSMAAPHAAGAILLLKEAFPMLSGIDIKLALYHSASDMGEPGEDNVFGMGMIDLESAFNYLVAAGHEPANPTVEQDLSIENFKYFVDPCTGQVAYEVILKNEGTAPISDILLEIIDDLSTLMIEEVPFSLEPGEQVVHTFQLPLVEDGIYNLIVKAIMPGIADERSLNNSIRTYFNYEKIEEWTLSLNEDLVGSDLCGGTRVLASNQNREGTLIWYTADDEFSPIFTGNDYSITLPDADTSLHFFIGLELNKSVINPDEQVEKVAFLPEENSGFTFFTSQEVRLEEFSFECTERTFLSITITDEDGGSYWSANRFYNEGVQSVSPNVVIPRGRVVKIQILGNRELTTPNFDHLPAGIPGYVSILETVINNEVSDELLFPIFDVVFAYEIPCARKPLSLQVSASQVIPLANFSTLPGEPVLPANQPILFVNESESAETFEWNFGDGTLSDEEIPTHTYFEGGAYLVSLKAFQSDGCFDVHTQLIVIEDDATTSLIDLSQSDLISIYPNPAKNELNIQLEDPSERIISVQLINMNGQVLANNPITLQASVYRVDLSSNIPTGMYVVRAMMEDGSSRFGRVVIH